MYRSPSPYGSPYTGPPQESHYSSSYTAPQSPGGAAQITPGSITYTTSTGPDGNIVYHPFKAVPASYQTPTGIVTGIQWVPAEATRILPAGAEPATVEFADAWSRGNLSRDEQKNLRDWQRGEEKRRRREEKESTKMLRDKDRLNQARFDDTDLRMARERDAASLQRRKSFNQGAPPSVAFPAGGPGVSGAYPSYAAGNPGYPSPRAPSPNLGFSRERKYSTGGGLAEQFADLGLDHEVHPGGMARPRKFSTHGEATERERARRMSGNFGIERPPSAYGTKTYPGTGVYANPSPGLRSTEPSYMATPRPTSPYGNTNYPPTTQDPYARAASPFGRTGSPYHRASSPFAPGGVDAYPSGHIMEGRPIGSGIRSRATTPIPGMPPGAYPQPGMPVGMSPNAGTLAAPECFSRPINAAHPYTPFEAMKIQDMDMFLEILPRIPVVLQTHDVYNEDWTRLMDDVGLAWSGRLPVPVPPINGKPPKRATLVAKLIELWNHSFFERRGVELVLYKGRERRSGQQYGAVDMPYDDNDEFSTSSDSSTDDDDDSRLSGFYGGYPTDMPDARHKRIVAKAEKKRRRKEKKLRRKEKEKRYSLWLFCLPQGGPGGAGSAYGAPGIISGNTGYGGMPQGGAYGSHSPAPGGVAFGRSSPVPGYSGLPQAGVYGSHSPAPGGAAFGRTSPVPGYGNLPQGGAYGSQSPALGGAAFGRSSPVPGYSRPQQMSSYPGMMPPI